MDKQELSFEQSCDALQELITKIESGSLSLKDSIKAFEEGEKLIKNCYNQLSQAKGKLSEIKSTLDKLEEI